MEATRPIVAALALDGSTPIVVEAAVALSRQLHAPIIPIHAVVGRVGGAVADELATRAQETLVAQFGAAAREKVEVAPPVVRHVDPVELAIDVAARHNAQLIVCGSGQAATVREWLLGSVAHRMVRYAHPPVWMARGSLPTTGNLIVVPVDFTPHARMGVHVALRMARQFGASVRVLHVSPSGTHPLLGTSTLREAADRVAEAESQLAELVRAHDTVGLDVELRVRSGDAAGQILEDIAEAQLVVLASRSFRKLLPASIGGVAEKVLRNAKCSVLAVRDDDPQSEAREAYVRHVADIKREAQSLVDRYPARAERMLKLASVQAPMNASIQDLLADAVERQGRKEEAANIRRFAKSIRESLS